MDKGTGMSRRRRTGLIFAVTSAVCFGFSGPLAKAFIDTRVSPLQVAWLRLGGAGLVLLAITAVVNPRALVVPRDRWRFVAAFSVLGFAAVQALYYATVARMPVGIAILLEYLSLVLIVGWVRLVRRVPLPGAALAGAMLALAGLACVVEVWRGLRIDALGLVFGLGTAACAAAYFLLSQNAGDGVHPLGSLTWGALGAAVVLIPLAHPWRLPWHVLAGSLAMGKLILPAPLAGAWLILVPTVAAYAASIAALRRLTAAVGATVASLEVISTAVIAWVMLGESLGPAQLAGGAIVLAGVVLAQRALARLPAAAAPADEVLPRSYSVR